MKILLLQPSSLYYQGSENPRLQIPVGLLSIAAAIASQQNIDIKVHDARLTGTLDRTKDGRRRFGESLTETNQIIKKFNPHLIGISHLFTSQRDATLEVLQLITKIHPRPIIIIGGPAASVEYEILLQNETVDCVVIGEGEETFLDIIHAIEKGHPFDEIPGVALRHPSGEIIRTPKRAMIQDLDRLPFPAYHLLDMERYFTLQRKGMGPVAREITRRSIPIVTSRGCPFSCTFCSIHPTMGKIWRANTAGYILKHISYVMDEYGVDLIHFSDDNLSLRPDRLAEIAQGIVQAGFPIKWDTPNGLRADRLDYELLKKMKESGCIGIHIAIESGVQRVLDHVIGKKLKLYEVERVVKDSQRLGLDLQAFYVIGLPGETLEDIRTTCRYARKLYWKYGVYPHLSIATPLPGTTLLKICEENGYLCNQITPQSISEAKQFFGTGLIETPEFSRQDIAKEIKTFRRFIIASFLKQSLLNPQKGLRDIRAIIKNPFYLFHKFIISR